MFGEHKEKSSTIKIKMTVLSYNLLHQFSEIDYRAKKINPENFWN